MSKGLSEVGDLYIFVRFVIGNPMDIDLLLYIDIVLVSYTGCMARGVPNFKFEYNCLPLKKKSHFIGLFLRFVELRIMAYKIIYFEKV